MSKNLNSSRPTRDTPINTIYNPPTMNSAQSSFDNADLERLSDKDKGDLRQFLANEQQRATIQTRKSLPRATLSRSSHARRRQMAVSTNRKANSGFF